ncbi:hypothetical protein SCHPADRAFT_612241 [Schizopora paradoxa]|uniref:Secreted protein n=1 Tax=Schizopora paradoxa TaxID=27342 RepID=A0A0H2RAA1_9AGAM|nr:hypothetical protein SCHPADRAFT_612241 [Schizopora paradoxa]
MFKSLLTIVSFLAVTGFTVAAPVPQGLLDDIFGDPTAGMDGPDGTATDPGALSSVTGLLGGGGAAADPSTNGPDGTSTPSDPLSEILAVLS